MKDLGQTNKKKRSEGFLGENEVSKACRDTVVCGPAILYSDVEQVER